jgi:hypothetical protein
LKEEGFRRIVGWIDFYVAMLQAVFARQETLLQEMTPLSETC